MNPTKLKINCDGCLSELSNDPEMAMKICPGVTLRFCTQCADKLKTKFLEDVRVLQSNCHVETK